MSISPRPGQRSPGTTTPVGRLVAAALTFALLAGIGGAAPATATPGTPAGSIDPACRTFDAAGGLFHDVPAGHTHAAAISCLAAWGITSGTGNGLFAPDASVTRGQMATLLVGLLDRSAAVTIGSAGPVPGAGPTFSDIAGHTHEGGIEALARVGVVSGAGGLFRPDGSVTRGQMATMLVRLLEGVHGETYPEGPTFSDIAGDTHASAIRKLAASGIARGGADDRFQPSALVTRAQMATFVMRTAAVLVVAGKAEVPTASGSISS